MTIRYQNQTWKDKKIIVGETDLDPQKPLNLLIGFHGADSTPENMLIHGNKLSLTNTLMVYPEGPVDVGDGLWSWWPDGPKQKESVTQFLDYTSGIIDEAHSFIEETYEGTSFNTCLWGFSQGGAASLVYALHGSHPLHKVASLCGFLPELPEDAPKNQATQILGIFGANDEVIPSFLAEFALDEMKGHGHTTTSKETPQGHEVNQDNINDLMEFFGK